MAGIFDKLHGDIGGDEDDGGLSILDLADLPPAQLTLMRMMLREVEMPEDELREAVSAWPEDQRMNEEELTETLDALSNNQWLIRMGEENITYKANLRRKRGSEVAKSIWGNLNAKITQSAPPPPEE
jgi:hypothetical protein